MQGWYNRILIRLKDVHVKTNHCDWRSGLHTSQVAHQAGAFLRVSVAWSDWGYFYSPLDRMIVHRRVTPSIKFASTHLYTWVEIGTMKVKCLAQEGNTMSPARAWQLPCDSKSKALVTSTASTLRIRLHSDNKDSIKRGAQGYLTRFSSASAWFSSSFPKSFFLRSSSSCY